jgi:hypothetical protein
VVAAGVAPRAGRLVGRPPVTTWRLLLLIAGLAAQGYYLGVHLVDRPALLEALMPEPPEPVPERTEPTAVVHDRPGPDTIGRPVAPGPDGRLPPQTPWIEGVIISAVEAIRADLADMAAGQYTGEHSQAWLDGQRP